VNHSHRTLFALIGLVLAGSLVAFAETPLRDHDIVAEDYFDLTVVGNLAVSPDGRTAAYTESRWGRGKEGRSTDLWTVERESGAATRLTFDGFGGQSPVWSPDGMTLFFLGRDRSGSDSPPRDGSRQVWRLARTGGSPVAVTRTKGGVGSFCLSPDGRALFFTVSSDETEETWKDLREKYSDLEYGHGVRQLDGVRRLDLDTWREEEILPADRVIWEMAMSPDGTRLALITTTDNELIFMEGWSRVEIFDIATGETTPVTHPEWRSSHPSPFGWLEDVTWSQDGGAVAFSISYDGFASRLWYSEQVDGAWPLTLVDRPHPVNYDGGLTWRGDRTLCYKGEAMGRVHVFGVEKTRDGEQGKTVALLDGNVVTSAFGFDAKGDHFTAVFETPTDGNDVYAIEGPDKFTRLTRANPQIDTWKLPAIEHMSWTGADGDDVHGILELPPGYMKEDGPLPTIIELHGGPTSSSKHRLRLWIYGRALMAAKGYALLSPNYHGSTGYGDEFLEKLIGRENEIEVEDISLGTKWLIEQGYADPDKIGVMGWSNGGYLTNCMIVAEPDMFAAASSGAGVLDMVIQWGTEDTPGHVINFVTGLPWEKPDHYLAASPLYNLDNVKTPTIIHVGGSDPRVPPAHSRALYRALKHYLDVPTELVVYPGEPHGLTTHENRLAKITWDLAWFEKYLLGKQE